MKTKNNKNDLTATWIKSSGEQTIVEPANGSHFTLEELQGYVGGYIQLLFTPLWKGNRIIQPHLDRKGILTGFKKAIYVNEEGKLIGLPPNPDATALWLFEGLVGDVLVMSENDYRLQNSRWDTENAYRLQDSRSESTEKE